MKRNLQQLSHVPLSKVENVLLNTKLTQLFTVHNNYYVNIFHKSIFDWFTCIPPFEVAMAVLSKTPLLG